MEQQTLIGLCAAGLVICVGMLFMGDKTSGESKRVREFSGKKTIGSNLKDRLKVEDTGARRKQIEETLGKIEERQNAKKKKSKTLEARMLQADWSMNPQTFLVISVGLAAVAGVLPFIMGMKPLLCLALAFVAGFGLPRFVLNSAISRRQKKFTAHFADAMDIIVRGVRTGLLWAIVSKLLHMRVRIHWVQNFDGWLRVRPWVFLSKSVSSKCTKECRFQKLIFSRLF